MTGQFPYVPFLYGLYVSSAYDRNVPPVEHVSSGRWPKRSGFLGPASHLPDETCSGRCTSHRLPDETYIPYRKEVIPRAHAKKGYARNDWS